MAETPHPTGNNERISPSGGGGPLPPFVTKRGAEQLRGRVSNGLDPGVVALTADAKGAGRLDLRAEGLGMVVLTASRTVNGGFEKQIAVFEEARVHVEIALECRCKGGSGACGGGGKLSQNKIYR